MKKGILVIRNILSADKLQRRMKESDSIEQFKRFQVVFLSLTNPDMPASQLAQDTRRATGQISGINLRMRGHLA